MTIDPFEDRARGRGRRANISTSVGDLVGSNLPGATLKKQKKRRPANLFFRPSLESLLEAEEVVLNFPLWIVPAPKFAQRAFPTESVVVQASANAEEVDDADVDSALAKEGHIVGRLRRKKYAKEEGERETAMMRMDTYGKWMQAQCSSVCREESEGAESGYDRVFRAIESYNNEALEARRRVCLCWTSMLGQVSEHAPNGRRLCEQQEDCQASAQARGQLRCRQQLRQHGAPLRSRVPTAQHNKVPAAQGRVTRHKKQPGRGRRREGPHRGAVVGTTSKTGQNGPSLGKYYSILYEFVVVIN